MKVFVLCLNDYPIGVYNSYDEASAARQEFDKNFEPYRVNRAMLHYHTHSFELGAPAKQ